MPLDERSAQLRSHVLLPSGGWLGEVTVFVSDLFGLWDIFALMTFFVIAWIIVRTVAPIMSIPLGLIFDLSIPMQYQNHESTRDMHKDHLSGYWPVFLVGTAVEIASFMMLFPDMFTLVVAIKTTICLTIWLSRRADGSKVSLAGLMWTKPRSATSTVPTNSRPKRPSLPGPGSSSRAPSSTRQPSAGKAPAPSNLPNSKHPSAEKVRREMEKRFPGIDDTLKRAGYDSLTREGMLVHMANARSRAPTVLESWLKTAGDPAQMASRKAKYTKKALEYRLDWEKRHPGYNSQSTQSGSGRPRKMFKQTEHTIKGLMMILAQLEKYNGKIPIPRTPDEWQIENWERLFKTYNVPFVTLEAPILEDKIPLREQEKRFNWLTDYKHGLGVPSDMANGMMMEMLNQPTVEEADRLFAYWQSVKKMSRAQREAFRRDSDERYAAWGGEGLGDFPVVWWPWQGVLE